MLSSSCIPQREYSPNKFFAKYLKTRYSFDDNVNQNCVLTNLDAGKKSIFFFESTLIL